MTYLATVDPDGSVLLVPQVLVPAEQAWFWTPEWQAGEREADADLAAGRSTRYDSTDALDEALAAVPAADD